MDKIEMVLETLCAGGVVAAPLWLVYKLVLFVFQ